MNSERITKIQEIISELDGLISQLQGKGKEIDIERCKEVRSGYIDDLIQTEFEN